MALVLLTWWVAKLGFGDWAWVELSDTAASVYRLSIDLAFKKGLTTHMFQIIYIYRYDDETMAYLGHIRTNPVRSPATGALI